MTVKNHRLELRTDELTDELITEAAALLHTSKSAFVADAARDAARRIIARADITFMAPEQFDLLMSTLDTADESPGLDALAVLPRRISR